jgi:predicted O-methyltransferase YrrM
MKKLSRYLRLPFNRAFAERRLSEYHTRPRSLEETVDWAMNFGGGGFLTIKTLQRPPEITRLAERVRALRPAIILEIGTARGGTLLIWSSLASARVITCDLNDMHVQAPLFTRLAPVDSDCAVTLLSGDSHSAVFKQRVAEALAGEKADFLFIDGDHTANGVTADYLDYREFVRPGGLIAFHDIVEKQPLPTNQVYQLWVRLKQVAEYEEIIEDPQQCGFGIGIIRVPEGSAPSLPD